MAKDVAQVAAGTALLKMIVADTPEPGAVASAVTLWSHEVDGGPAAEIGGMVLRVDHWCRILHP